MGAEPRFARVRELFDLAIDLPRERRDERVLAAAGGDTALAREVGELIEAAEDAPEFLDDELLGTRAGVYRIDAVLGSGGMGTAYRATREGGDVEVALKVVRPGLESPGFSSRFAAEQRALNRLDHPHIVTLQDAGRLPDGRPFLVTELVHGARIDRHCAAEALDAPAIVELVVQVCEAVHHAHERLIVHCDLKPENVLVTRAGTPKLLDFGIARVVGASGPELAGGTPGYASPEQARGEPVTVATDVYALGAVLARLLRGAGVADRDLLAIVARATAEDPAERYRSVDQLRGELRAFLAGLPVAARGGGVAYRLRKLARRHRVAFAASVVAVLSLVFGCVGLFAGLQSARAEARTGWGAHGQIRIVSTFLEELLATTRGMPADRFERELDLACAEIDRRFGAWPEAEGRIRIAVGALYLDLARPAKAAAHLERGLELASTHRGFGEDDRERARALLDRARAD